jgi:hypothetical protein
LKWSAAAAVVPAAAPAAVLVAIRFSILFTPKEAQEVTPPAVAGLEEVEGPEPPRRELMAMAAAAAQLSDPR